MQERAVLRKLQSLLHEVDRVFAAMRRRFPQEVRCESGCVDCCHACFDVSFAEAYFLHKQLDVLCDRIKEEAGQAKAVIDQYIFEKEKGPLEGEFREEVSRWRIKCMLLTKDNTCAAYDFRPLTCRAYGLPTSFQGQGHVCGFSGFERGGTYPTVKLDTIAGHLGKLSADLATAKGFPPELAERRFFLHEIILPEFVKRLL